MIRLTELERDVINETFNIGIGQAASSLSQMLQHEILLSVPRIDVLTPDEIISSIDHTDSVFNGVCEKFGGTFSGYAMLLLPEANSRNLVQLIYQQHQPEDQIEKLEQDILIEVGNILINACLSSMTELSGEEIKNQIPEAAKGSLNEVFQQQGEFLDNKRHLIHLSIHFDVPDTLINGAISFLMRISSLGKFREQVAKKFGIT